MKSAVVLVAAFLAGTAPAFAQNSIGDAVLALWSGAGDASVQTVNGRIYGGTIEATVLNVDGDGTTLGATDLVPAFRISRNGTALVFPAGLDASRAAFNRWVDDNASAILALLFPSSISESLTGRDAAQNHSQQFLLTTALATSSARRAGGTSRARAGGLLEFERLDTPGQTGHAWQGLYQLEGGHTSIQGRVTQQTRTSARCARPARAPTRWRPTTTLDRSSTRRCWCAWASTPARGCSTRTATRSTSARSTLAAACGRRCRRISTRCAWRAPDCSRARRASCRPASSATSCGCWPMRSTIAASRGISGTAWWAATRSPTAPR